MQLITITLDKESKWNSSTAKNFVNALLERYGFHYSETGKALYLDIVADHTAVIYQVFVQHENDADSLNQLVRTYYPDAQIISIGWLEPTYFPVHSQTAIFYRPDKLDGTIPAYVPSSTIAPKQDPLIYLTNAMSNLIEGEVITYRLQLMNYEKVNKGFFDFLSDIFQDAIAMEHSPYYRTDKQKLRAETDERMKSKVAVTRISVQMYVQDTNRFTILEDVVSAIAPLSTWGVFSSTYRLKEEKIQSDDKYRDSYFNHIVDRVSDKVWANSGFLLTADELASFWHLPHEEFAAPKVLWNREEAQNILPEPLREIEGVHIGESYEHPVHLPTDDRTTHTMIIGKTGTGKTTSMHHLITHDVAQGHGIMVIDPTGNLITSILAHSIPDERIDDVVLLDFGLEVDGVRYPPPLNPLFKIRTEDGSSRLAPDLTTVMNRVYEDFEASQMGDLLEIVLQYLAIEEKPILRDIRRFLREDNYRAELSSKNSNPALDEDWEDIEEDWKTVKRQSYRPLMRRLRSFYKDNQAMAATCHPDTFDIPKYLRENKIVLINVSPDNNNLSDKERYVLGSMVVSQLFNVARRQKINGKPFMLYVDETENFVTMPLADMLARARQYNIGLVLANQWLSQFAGNQQAVEGNVGAMLAFEVGREDANIMRHYMNTFEAEDLMRLGEHKVAISIRYNKERLNSFLVNTAPPYTLDLDEADIQKRVEMIKRASIRNQSMRPYDEIIDWVDSKYSTNSDDNADGEDDDFTEEEA